MMKIGIFGALALPLLFALTARRAEAAPAEEIAVFAGGCFWCMESPFEKVDGVSAVISGYTGGTKENPTYQEVSAGTTGHAEAVQVHFDPAKVGYDRLLEIFWRQVDPTDAGGQFVDRGSQYRAAIFYATDEQKRLAEASKAKLAATRSASPSRWSPRSCRPGSSGPPRTTTRTTTRKTRSATSTTAGARGATSSSTRPGGRIAAPPTSTRPRAPPRGTRSSNPRRRS